MKRIKKKEQVEVGVEIELEVFSSKIICCSVALKHTDGRASWPPSRAFMAKDAREQPLLRPSSRCFPRLRIGGTGLARGYLI